MITNQPVLTLGAVALALVVAIAGAVAVGTGSLDFDDYVQAVGVVAAGHLGLGSGIARGLQGQGSATSRPLDEFPKEYQ
jgi:hypothetical protein